MTLSPAATIVLTRAAERPDHRLEFHRKLPTGGRHKMIDALLRDGLIAETRGDYRLGDGSTKFEDAATGLMLTTLTLTDAGFRAIDRAPSGTTDPPATVADPAPHRASAETVAQEAAAVADALDAAPVAPNARANLRSAAAAVLAAWDDEENRTTDIVVALKAPMDALRALLGEPAPRTAGMPRKPREGTKQEAVLALLARSEGTTIAQIIEATGWQQHTVRGFLAGLKRKGTAVEPIERVRQVGPDKAGTKGSYTVYRLAAAA
jgi:hypothetical protein